MCKCKIAIAVGAKVTVNVLAQKAQEQGDFSLRSAYYRGGYDEAIIRVPDGNLMENVE